MRLTSFARRIETPSRDPLQGSQGARLRGTRRLHLARDVIAPQGYSATYQFHNTADGHLSRQRGNSVRTGGGPAAVIGDERRKTSTGLVGGPLSGFERDGKARQVG